MICTHTKCGMIIVTPSRYGSGVMWWACLSVCCAVCLRAYLGTMCPNFTKVSVHVVCSCG